MPPPTDLAALLRDLQPERNPGVFVFATLAPGQHVDPAELVALVREPEGVSVVVAEQTAARLGLRATFRCAWITLRVTSELQAVGLTAAFSAALGGAGISCNVVAGTNHDHVFVPIDRAEAAMSVLRQLQHEGAGPQSG